MPPTSTMPGAAKLDTTTSDSFANIIANLKLNSSVLANLNGYLANAANTTDSDLTATTADGASGTNAKLTTASPITLPPSLVNQYKSFFKTIKIFVASNKDGNLGILIDCILKCNCFPSHRIRLRDRVSIARDSARAAAVLYAIRL